MAAGADSIASGVAVAAGSMVLRLLGVEPGTVAAAAAACVLGAPFARPAGGVFRAAATYAASVVVTCHAAAGCGALAGLWWPAAEAHQGKVQALAAVVVGVLLHVVVAQAPAIVPAILARVGVRA